MPPKAIALQRLYQQRLSHAPLATPEEVVGWLGAVQSQEYAGAKWSLALRMQDPQDDAIERAYNEGTILRTHVLRPTWHFVPAADIRWMLELTAPRILAQSGHRSRQLELDAAQYALSNEIIARALQGGLYLTRPELGGALAEAGIPAADGSRLGHIVMHAELEAVICSGPRRGKQMTYALLDERAPHARSLPREEALAELTRRYFTGHGPATVRDFVWWSGLTMADARAGLAMCDTHLTREEIDGSAYWFSATSQPVAKPYERANLLPTFDEFLVGYAGFGASRTEGWNISEVGAFAAMIVLRGRIVGSWRRTFKGRTIVMELTPFAPLAGAEYEAVTAAADRYGEFVGMPVTYES
jgi:hypothetical protein